LRLLRASSAMDQARATLRSYAETARHTLAGLPDLPARTAFEALSELVIARTG
jgi:heptaprenyl diphosphate synthase